MTLRRLAPDRKYLHPVNRLAARARKVLCFALWRRIAGRAPGRCHARIEVSKAGGDFVPTLHPGWPAAYLRQSFEQTSRASGWAQEWIALAKAGDDTINAVKQAGVMSSPRVPRRFIPARPQFGRARHRACYRQADRGDA